MIIEKNKDCHKCSHYRVCHLYSKLRNDKDLGVFFVNYKINTFATICDNYKKE